MWRRKIMLPLQAKGFLCRCRSRRYSWSRKKSKINLFCQKNVKRRQQQHLRMAEEEQYSDICTFTGYYCFHFTAAGAAACALLDR
jgi:hypothetical protein